MAGSTRGGLGETVAEFMRRRRQEVENFGRDAEATAMRAYGRAIRAGEDLALPDPADVMRYGAHLIGVDPTPATRKRTVQVTAGRPANSPPKTKGAASSGAGSKALPPEGDSWLDRSAIAKHLAGEAARTAALLPGAARGAWHTVEGLADAVNFAGRLLDPYDAESSPRGEAALDQVIDASKGVAHYVHNAMPDPRSVADDIGEGFHRFRVKNDATATPQARTLLGEVKRNFGIGLNQGETAFDVVSVPYGGAELKGLSGIGKVSKAAQEARFLARGYPSNVAKYFAEPYAGVGHHFLPRRVELPTWLGGGPVPDAVSDSPFFLLRPKGMTNGDFFELHYGVDPHYYGGRIRKEFGPGRWSGKELGWKKHGPLGRIGYGSPGPLKATVGAGAAGAGAVIDDVVSREGDQ